MVEVTAPTFFDRSHWGRIYVTGDDRLRFLHNQSTNDFQQRLPGQGCDTVFVSSTARTLDLASAYIDDEGVLLLVSPGMSAELISWMDRYIFFADKVTLTDKTDATFAITLLGAKVDQLLAQMGGDSPDNVPGSHVHATVLDSVTIQVARGTGLATPGYTLIGPKEHHAAILQWLKQHQVAQMSAEQWEIHRIRQGRPMPGHELTDQENPLEAGLWQTISFEKGCYIGQETIARLNTYQGVKKQLWGFQLEKPVLAGASLQLDGSQVGKLTSVAVDDDGVWGLGYLRTKAGGAGLTLDVEDTTARAVEIPFVSRGYLDSGSEDK